MVRVQNIHSSPPQGEIVLSVYCLSSFHQKVKTYTDIKKSLIHEDLFEPFAKMELECKSAIVHRTVQGSISETKSIFLHC